jgi:hypothetical protein
MKLLLIILLIFLPSSNALQKQIVISLQNSRVKKIIQYMMVFEERIHNNNNEFLIEMKKIKMAMHKNNSGHDERFQESPANDTELLSTIKLNMMKLDLLKLLEKKEDSIVNKMRIIEENKYLFDDSGMTYNISAGGLWNDFQQEII